MIWTLFFVLIFASLVLDLGIFEKQPHVLTTREATFKTTIWVTLALAFSMIVYLSYEQGWVANPGDLSGREAVWHYLTGYLVEQSLSLDNIFVMAVIFTYFRIPAEHQNRVLYWGIIGALVFRGLMIWLGVMLIREMGWVMYVFGALLLYSAYRLARPRDASVDVSRNPAVRLVKVFIPVLSDLRKQRFFVRENGLLKATPLFVALIVIETTDIVFAFDSIPAIFAITTDPFLVFSSNIFAILGLRSLYFVLASVLDRFHYLQYSLIFILAFVGVKLLLHHHVHFPSGLSFFVILFALSAGIGYSTWSDKQAALKVERTKNPAGAKL